MDILDITENDRPSKADISDSFGKDEALDMREHDRDQAIDEL